jgi:hypothetical protein
MSSGMGLGGSVVSKNILEHKGVLKWCIKEAPINELDNGWRFLSDVDTDDFLANPSNMLICDWSTIIELEPAVIKIFNMPQGTDITLMDEDGSRFFVYTATQELVRF